MRLAALASLLLSTSALAAELYSDPVLPFVNVTTPRTTLAPSGLWSFRGALGLSGSPLVCRREGVTTPVVQFIQNTSVGGVVSVNRDVELGVGANFRLVGLNGLTPCALDEPNGVYWGAGDPTVRLRSPAA